MRKTTPTFSKNNKNKGEKGPIIFFFMIILIDFWWLLGTKVSDFLLDNLINDFSLSQDQAINVIQQMDAVFNFTTAISVILFGIIVDKNPNKRKKIMILANSPWILMNIIINMTPLTITNYLLLQLFWGISMGANGPLIFSYLGDLFRIDSRGRLFSFFAIFLYFIKGGSNIITGFIGNAFGSWKAPLLIMAIGSVITLLIYYFFISEPKLARAEPEFTQLLDKKALEYSYKLDWKDIKEIFSQKTNFLFLLQGIFGMIGVVIVQRYLMYWLTSDKRDGLALPITIATLLLTIGGILGDFLGIMSAGWFADKQFKKGRLDKMLLFSTLCIFGQIIGYGLLVYLPAYPAEIDPTIENIGVFLETYPAFWQFIVIFNFCLFMGTAIGPVVGTARTHINLPEHRGTAAALYDTFDFIGAGIALLVGGYLSSTLESFREVIFFGSLSWLISGTIWIFIMKYINNDFKMIRQTLETRANEILNQTKDSLQ